MDEGKTEKIYITTKYINDAAQPEQSCARIPVGIFLASAHRDITRGSINHAGHISILTASRVVVRAMSVNASRGCKHVSRCADGEQARRDRKSSWLSACLNFYRCIYADYHPRIPCPLHTWRDSEFLRESDGAA